MARRKRRIPFRYLEPVFFGGLLDDPLLFLRVRPAGHALLFDCGQNAHLAKRVVKPVDTVFVSHAHMDHAMGIPTLVRHHHASPKPLAIYGPPGMAERVGHMLQAYDWNLCEPYWFTLLIHEVHERVLRRFAFRGPEGFAGSFLGEEPRIGKTIWESRYVRVSAELLDHKIPVLAFRIDEKPPFNVDPARLAAAGLTAGDWLRDLKSRLWQQPLPGGRSGVKLGENDGELYDRICGEPACASIGYLTDIGWTAENRARVAGLFGGLTLLVSECTFLAADLAKARASCHLCTSDLNELAGLLKPAWLLPMHLSKSYLRRTVDLYTELSLPAATGLLTLPRHLAPAPLKCEDLAHWLRPGQRDRQPTP